MDAASPDPSDPHAADHADDAAEGSTDAADDAAVEAETVEAEATEAACAPPKTLLQALGDTTNRNLAVVVLLSSLWNGQTSVGQDFSKCWTLGIS